MLKAKWTRSLQCTYSFSQTCAKYGATEVTEVVSVFRDHLRWKEHLKSLELAR